MMESSPSPPKKREKRNGLLSKRAHTQVQLSCVKQRKCRTHLSKYKFIHTVFPCLSFFFFFFFFRLFCLSRFPSTFFVFIIWTPRYFLSFSVSLSTELKTQKKKRKKKCIILPNASFLSVDTFFFFLLTRTLLFFFFFLNKDVLFYFLLSFFLLNL